MSGLERLDAGALLAILRDPTSNPRQAALLIAVAVVVLIIGLLVAGIALVGGEARRPAGASQARRAARRRRELWIVLAGWMAVGASVLAAGGIVLTDTATCARCHKDRLEMSVQRAAAHSEIACASCHAEPGLGGRAALGIQTAGDVIERFTGTAAGIASRRPRSSACLACHGAIGSAVVRKIVRVSHREFVGDPAYPCTDCHMGIGHGPRGEPDDRPRMTLCLRCHDGEKASSDCSVCHPGGITDVRGVSKYDYPQVQLPPVTSCEGCHSLERCDACHGLRLPHPPGWRDVGQHGRRGAFDGRDLCKKCHDRADCATDCHPSQSFPGDSHPAEWPKIHGVDRSREALDRCRQCHTAPDFTCEACHP